MQEKQYKWESLEGLLYERDRVPGREVLATYCVYRNHYLDGKSSAEALSHSTELNLSLSERYGMSLAAPHDDNLTQEDIRKACETIEKDLWTMMREEVFKNPLQAWFLMVPWKLQQGYNEFASLRQLFHSTIMEVLGDDYTSPGEVSASSEFVFITLRHLFFMCANRSNVLFTSTMKQ